jgi:hypothetical protein
MQDRRGRLVQQYAIDHYDGYPITYPVSEPQMKFDFLFKHKSEKEWRYLFSFDYPTPELENTKKAAQCSGEWRIIAVKFGFVVDQG